MKTNAQAMARREIILRMLDGGKEITVQEFMTALKCSYATIRNDLEYLEQEGVVLRTHGGALRTDRTPLITLGRREDSNIEPKRAIACAAVKLFVRPGNTVILDAGTTNLAIARVIAQTDMPLKILTHSVPVINLLAPLKHVQVYGFGGMYNANSAAFLNGDIRRLRNELRADVYFMGFNGYWAGKGFSHAVSEEMEYKRSFISMAEKTVAVGDSAKLEQSGLWIAGTLQEVWALVTDGSIGENRMSLLQQDGLTVEKA